MCAAGLLLSLLRVGSAGGQSPPIHARNEIAAGAELENYLRTLQSLGVVRQHPWSLRKFSPPELDRLAPDTNSHPWAERFEFMQANGVTLARPQAILRFNSAFPHGSNDGAIWAGRGLTASLSGGAALRYGPLFAAAAPIAFWAQNRAFPLTPNAHDGLLRFADGRNPTFIDRPQRFGDQALSRVDAGESTLRLDVTGVSLGFSNAHEWWGPAAHYPFLLGNNAAGFPHVFVGTSIPLNLWIARVHGRILWGRLEQSDYFEPPPEIGRPRRFATGLAIVVQPRGLEVLELGVARFIHAPWPDEGLPGRYVTRAFEGIFKKSLPVLENPIPHDDRSQDGENQLGSIFARLLLPGTGFELYTEFGREDHPWDRRALVLHPDEQASLTMGARKAWRSGANRIAVLRGESINFQQNSISRTRGGSVTYLHFSGSNQGHTNRGQLLGAAVGSGSAAGSVLALDVLEPAGRWTIEWTRTVRQEAVGLAPDGGANTRALDVQHALTIERLLFRGGVDVLAAMGGVYNFNRNFDSDVTNLSLRLGITGLPW